MAAQNGRTWFSRSSIVPELQKHVSSEGVSSGRKAFFDENGDDLRLRQPGFDWSIISARRHKLVDDFTQQFTNIFDEFYEKITGDKPHRRSSIVPILPSTKTPGRTMHNSRIQPIPEKTFSPVSKQQPVGEMTEQVTPAKVNHTEIKPATEFTSQPAPTRSQRGKKKAPQEKRDSSEFIPQRKSTRALTRQQTKAADPPPTTRTRHARACKATNQISPDDVEMELRSPVVLQSSLFGISSEEPIKVKNNRLARKLSINRNSNGSCRVSIEKASVQPSISEVNDQTQAVFIDIEQVNSPVSTPPFNQASVNTDQAEIAEIDGNTNKAELIINLTPNAESDDTPGVCSAIVTEVSDNVSILSLQTSPRAMEPGALVLQATPSKAGCPGSDVELSLARPTPPPRKGLKLRKKGSKKGAGKTKAKPGELKKPQDEDGLPLIKEITALEQSCPILPSGSAESLYESCVSEISTPPKSVSVTNQDQNKIGSKLHKTSEPSQPVNILDDSKMNEHRLNRPLTESLILPVDEATPQSAEQPVNKSPPSPILEIPESPVLSAPSYLTGTPRTLLKLREEYQSRTGGKLVSLGELLNSGGRSGSPLKKVSKLPKISKLARPFSPAQTPKATSTHSDPNKTPQLTHTYTRATQNHPENTKTPQPPAPCTPLIYKVDNAKTPQAVVSEEPEQLLDSNEVHPSGKRPRSNSLERLEGWSESGGEKRPCSDNYGDLGGGKREEESPGVDSPNNSDDFEDHFTGSSVNKKSTKPHTFMAGHLQEVMKGVVYKEGTNQPLSFLPRKSPKKQETVKEKKAQLANKLHHKDEVGRKRQEDLRSRRQQEMQEKIKKREERERKVAEKQAALRQKDEEKRKRIKGQQAQDQSKKVTIKKAKEIEEKNKKLKERMLAAEARRKLEEEQQQRRLHQLEEERKMATELAMKRREMEEEERKMKRREKLKQERERHLKRIEELKEQQQELKRRQDEETNKQVGESQKPHSNDGVPNKHSERVKHFEKLMGGAIAKVPVVTTPRISHVVGKTATNSCEKANKMLQAYYNGSQVVAPTPLSPAESRLNSTFTKNNTSTPPVTKAPPTSYQITPAESDPLYNYENYSIADLSASDSTDDEEDPRKVLPLWAQPESLHTMMLNQEKALTRNKVDLHKIFPPDQLLLDPDLGRIFRRKRQRYYQRSSSANWSSPMWKRNKLS